MKIVIQPSALADLKGGFRFYERQQTGLGSYFLDSLYSDIESLLLYAGIHPQHFGKHRLLSERFPCAVYYEVRQKIMPISRIYPPLFAVLLLLFSSSCKPRVAEPFEASRVVGQQGSLIESIDGVSVNFPHSESLPWMSPLNDKPDFSIAIAQGLQHFHIPSISEKHTLVVDRYSEIGDFVLLCGSFDPPFPDGSFNWIVYSPDGTYVGHFLDKNSQ